MNHFGNDDEKLTELKDRYLQFGLGSEKYGIRLLDVKEVIPVPETTDLPNTPGYYQGIMNLRGQIISVIDLRKKLGVKAKEENTEEAVIIIEIDKIGIGVIVDSIDKVLNVEDEQVLEVPEVKSQVNAQYIEGVFKNQDYLVVLLNFTSILNINEIKNMRKQAA